MSRSKTKISLFSLLVVVAIFASAGFVCTNFSHFKTYNAVTVSQLDSGPISEEQISSQHLSELDPDCIRQCCEPVCNIKSPDSVTSVAPGNAEDRWLPVSRSVYSYPLAIPVSLDDLSTAFKTPPDKKFLSFTNPVLRV